jgi:hypothetical protein
MASLGLPNYKERRCHPTSDIIRRIDTSAKITEQNLLEALQSIFPMEIIQAIVEQYGLARQRQRKLSAEMGLYLAIGMNLFAHFSLTQVLIKLVRGFRFVWPAPAFMPASKGAISQLRYEIGAKPIVALFHQVCQPITSPETPGAFLFGLRLMAIDASDETLPDTPENVKAFGRHTSGRGEAGYPQLKAVYLEEVGSHAILDAGFWPVHSGERLVGRRLLRSLRAGMLLMWDSGFHSLEMVKQTLKRKAHFLGRLPPQIKCLPVRTLPDGSQLVYLCHDYSKGTPREKILVRLIRYTVCDPALQDCGKPRLLITSLLHWRRYPALKLAQAYHERWEIEITIDETDTHQRRAFQPLRSQKPVGVIQELYGLLLAHYAIRKVMADAADLSGLDPDRLSFTNALRLIGDAIPEFQLASLEHHAHLYQQLLQDIARFRLPPRTPRINPRVVKRKMSTFEKKRPEHYHFPQPKTSFVNAIQILN